MPVVSQHLVHPELLCGLASLGGHCRGRVRGPSSRREAILDVFCLSRLVGVGEPVLAHEHVVGKADGAAGHEDLGDGETARHGEGW